MPLDIPCTKPTYSIHLVPVTDIDNIWPGVCVGLEDACQRTGGDINSSYLWGECRGGHSYLLISTNENAINGAGVFRFEDWSSGKKLRCLAMYGLEFTNWRDIALDAVKAIMQQGGAEHLILDGRKGWGEMLKNAKMIKITYEVTL